MNRCKDCSRVSEKSRCPAHLNSHRLRNKVYYDTHKEQTMQRQRERRWQTQYGITLAKYTEMLAAQNNMCAVCSSSTSNSKSHFFHVDHDHKCCPGKVTCGKCIRGLLCNRCNVGAGNLRDDPELVHKMEVYLLQYTNVLGDIV